MTVIQGDMDIWLQTGNENRDKLINALIYRQTYRD